MNSGIAHNRSLDSIEKALAEETKGKELWGDINISKEKYEILREKLKKVLAFNGCSFSLACQFFPCSITTFLVFLARYKYDINFWGLAGTELDREISVQNEKVLGDCARDTFERYKFDYSDVKGERRVYLEPILYEAGIPPESSLDDLFYIISSNTGDSFDPRLLIDDLRENRAYSIRKPLEKFLSRYGGDDSDRAVDYLLEVHDAVYSVEQGMDSNSIYIENYSEWKEHELSRESIRARKEKGNQAKPYLHFENGTKGLCLVLPKTILHDEWVSEATWTITGNDGYTLCKKMAVFSDGSRRYVESIEVPVRPEEEYTITLTDEDLFDSASQCEWTVPGIKRDGAILFNADGRLVNARFIPAPFGILVKGCNVPILECEGLSSTTQYYPTNSNDYQIICIEAESPNAVLKYRSNRIVTSLTLRPQINLSFSGETLFGRVATRPPYLFTSFPTLLVSAETADFIDGLELRCGSVKRELNSLASGDSVKIGLADLDNGRKNRYGLYSIRLYQNNHFLKQIEFYLVPNISTTYSPVNAYVGFSSKKRTYQFAKRKDCELQFQNCVVRSFPEDDTYYSIECAATTGFVPVVFKYTGEDHAFQFSFDLPVNPFQVELLEEDGSSSEEDAQKIGVSELVDRFHCLSIRVADVSGRMPLLLQLRTSDGIVQSETVRLAENGCGLVNLGTFYDTLRTCPLPARFELSRSGMDESPATIMTVADSVAFRSRPLFKSDFSYFLVHGADGENDITLKRFGRSQTEYHFFAEESVVSPNKKGVPVRRYPVADAILPGIYIVEGQRSSDLFIFEDEGSNSLQLTNGRNTIFVTPRKNDSEILCVSDWLDQLVQDILTCGTSKSATLDKLPSYLGLSKLDTLPVSLTSTDYEILIALVAFRTAKRADNRYCTILGKCMDAISEKCLSEEHRLELIRCLAEMSCSSEIVLDCITRYQLFLFYPGTTDALILSETMHQYSPELALLLKMGCDAPIRDTVANSRYLSLVGREALFSLLDVSDVPEPEKQNEIRKQFIREQPTSNISIFLSKEISGDMAPIQEMVVSTSKRNYYDYSKRPDNGMYFGQLRFSDQYINWYQKNTDRDQDLFAETEDKIQKAFRSYGNAILSGIKELKKVPQLREAVIHYDKALRGRCDDPEKNKTICSLGQFFYLEGMAAFLAMLPPEYRKYGWAIRPGTEFFLKAMAIAPEMAQRDILMAGTYLYLKRKESSLCR